MISDSIKDDSSLETFDLMYKDDFEEQDSDLKQKIGTL
jgi:hypothetical protein